MRDDLPGEPSFEGMPYAALRRFALGTSDAAERRRIDVWAEASASRRTYLAALVSTFARYQKSVSDRERPAADAAWAALNAKLEAPQVNDATPFVAPWEATAVEIDVRRRPARILAGAFESRRRWSPAPVAAAAALLIAAIGGLALYNHARVPISASQVVMREVATATGQRARIDLSDGSTIVLSVKSRLRFPSDFGAHTRELYLDGEAHFVVNHDAARPFIVHAAGSRTVDIGTAFVLRAYPTDRRVQVVVQEGSVGLGADHPGAGAPAPTVIMPGQMGRLATGATVPTVQRVDPAIYTAWMSDRLAFDNVPLSEVLTDIGRWHDVEIVLADPSLARETFTANFTADSFSETLNTITIVLNLRAERRGKTVVLHRRSPKR